MDPPASTLTDEPVPQPVTLRVTGWSLVRAVLLVGAGLLALGVVLAASTVLWWLAIATAVAAALHPAVTFLRRWMPAWAAIMVLIIAGVAFVGLVGYRGGQELSDQFNIVRGNAENAAREIQSSPQFGQVASEFGLVEKTTQFFRHLPAPLGTEGDAAATVQSAASSGSSLFAIATFAVLMLIFGSRLVRDGLMQVDDLVVRQRVGRLVYRAYDAAAGYVWMMALRAVALGIIGGLLCAAAGFETPTALGVAFAALSLVPGLGIVLAAIPVAIYVAITAPLAGAAVLAGALALQAVDASMVQRRIDERSVHVGPMATLVAALLGLQLYGFGGVLVGLAVAVYGLAVLRNLTGSHDEVLQAVRRLVGEDTTEAPELVVVEHVGPGEKLDDDVGHDGDPQPSP